MQEEELLFKGGRGGGRGVGKKVSDIEKDGDRSKGKGRRVCLWDRMYLFLVALAVLPRSISTKG